MSTQTVLLNKKLDRMRSQYRENVAAMESIKIDFEKSISERLSDIQQEMRDKLSEHDDSLRSEFENELEKYSSALNEELNRKIDEISSGYAKLKADNEEMQAQMKKTEKELNDELSGISGRLSSREESMKKEAMTRMEKVYNEFQAFSEKYPHEFFEPAAADALLMQMESVKTDFRSGFYEACMASASGIGFQISLIEERMKNSLDQWIRYFDQLESFTVLVSDFISSEEFVKVKSERFEKSLCSTSEREADTFDFWSEGGYSPVAVEIKKHREFTDTVYSSDGSTREEKIVSFLKNERKKGTQITFDELQRRMDELTELHKKICTMRVNIHTGFISSFERGAELSPKIISWLTGERCGEIITKGYRDNDIRNEYIIKAGEPGKIITVEIFPVCPDRMTVVNAVGVYFEHNGSGTVDNLKITEENFITQLKQYTANLSVIYESNCEGKFSDTGAAMSSIKNRAEENRRKELSVRRKLK